MQVGQKALFTVDSLPDKQFTARVSLVRQEPVTNNNVVTYVVEMIMPNEPLSDFDDDEKTSGKAPGREGPGGGPPKDGESRWCARSGKGLGAHEGPSARGHHEGGLPEAVPGTPGARQAKPMPMVLPTAKLDPQDLARIPGGSSMIPGPRFTGNLALRSGMTANVTIETAKHYDVLRVPNAALRFNPAAFLKDEKKADGPRLGQPMMFGGPAPRRRCPERHGHQGRRGAKREDRIWVLQNGKPKALVGEGRHLRRPVHGSERAKGSRKGCRSWWASRTTKQAGRRRRPPGRQPGRTR